MKLSPYIRGALFCVVVGPLVPASVSVVVGLLVKSPSALLFTIGVGYVLYAIPIALSSIMLVRNAFRAARKGKPLKSIRQKTSLGGGVLGLLIGLFTPLLFSATIELVGAGPSLGFDVLSVLLIGPFFGMPAAAVGLMMGYLLPHALGPSFREALKSSTPSLRWLRPAAL